MDRCGLKILDVELSDVNGGSFAVTVAKSDSSHKQNTEAIQQLLDSELAEGLDTLKPYEAFSARTFRHREQLVGLLDQLEADGATILGYGASTKGNVILQFCGLTPKRIPFMAEVNADKFGRFTPGSNIPIISEEQAHAMKPDYLLAMPWHFRENLLQRETGYLAAGGKMIFPLPDIEIVAK